jgi:hypothetical protein
MLTNRQILETIAANTQQLTYLLTELLWTVDTATGVHADLGPNAQPTGRILPRPAPPAPKTCCKCGQAHSPDKPGSALWEQLGHYICNRCLIANATPCHEQRI